MAHIPYILPHIVLRGTPFETGKRYGELTRERVALHLLNQKTSMAWLRQENPDWWRDEVHRYLPPYEELAPHFVEEMQGYARGAELTIDEVLLINVRDELLTSLMPAPADACTSFGCHGDVTLSRHPILGQTKDTARISKEIYVVLAMYQKGRPNLLQMPYAGEFGVIGLSSAGMAIFANSLYVKGRPAGRVPLSLFRRLVLESESVSDVITLIERHGLATPGSLTIGDAAGRVIALENTDHGHAVVDAADGILVHANHIDAPGLKGYGHYPEPERSASYRRQARLSEQLDAERGRLTPSLAMRCLMDHANYPRSICRHPSSAEDIQTTAAIVAEPTLGLLHIIRGSPCQGWPATYAL